MALPANGQTAKLGKGSILLDTLTAAGAKTGFEFMDNAISLSISADVTKAELFSSTERSAPKIAEAVVRTAYTLVATLTAYTLNNLKKFLLGTSNVKNQAVGVSQTASFTGAEVVQGRYLDVGSRRITNVGLTRDNTDAMVEGDDYSVLAEFGLIKILEGGAIQDGDDVDVEFDRPALVIDQVRIAREAASVCHLLYLADDANTDGVAAQDRLEIWRVSVAPEGEMNFISDEFGNFQLSMGVLSDAANHPNDPFGTLDRVRA